MKQTNLGFSLLCSFTLLAGCTGGSPSGSAETRKDTPPAAAAPGALDAAHKAYLEGDFTAVTERIRDVLLDPSSGALAKENAYELLDTAYEAQNGALPSAFKLPAGIDWIHYVNSRYVNPHGASFGFNLRGRMRDAKQLKGLTLKRLPDEIVLDKASGKGRFRVDPDDDTGHEQFVLDEEKNVEALPGDGVFTLRIELDDGTVSEGWFIVHALGSTASPQVLSPISSATIADRNPVIRWVPFRSPEYAAFEKRVVSAWLGRDDQPKSDWTFWAGHPGADIGHVQVGVDEGGTKTMLVPGNYWFTVSADEDRRFGPVRIIRASRTSQPFTLVR